jgi:hypothetical protein
VAALILTTGGIGLILRAAVERARRPPPAGTNVRSEDRSIAPGLARRSIVRRLGGRLVAAMSAGAAAIHLVAAADHVEALGDVGLGFYWAALFQGAVAFAYLVGRPGRLIGLVAIVVNLLLVAAWAWSRVTASPFSPSGPEAVGIADGVVVLLEVGVINVLLARLDGFDLRLVRRSAASTVRSVETTATVAVIGVTVLVTAIAMIDADRGHHGTDAAIHGVHAAPS